MRRQETKENGVEAYASSPAAVQRESRVIKNYRSFTFWCAICYTQIRHHVSLAKENTSHVGTEYNNWTTLDVQYIDNYAPQLWYVKPQTP